MQFIKSTMYKPTIAALIIMLGALSIIPAQHASAAGLETCEVFNDVYTITISTSDNQTLNVNDSPVFSLDVSSTVLSLDTDLLAGFYRANDGGTYTLVAWVPITENLVIGTEVQEVTVALPQALTAGDYRMVIYANPNAEQAKSYFYGDINGEAKLDFTVASDLSKSFLEVISLSEAPASTEGVESVNQIQYVVSVSNPYSDRAVRGGLLMYGFRGMTPDQTKLQTTQNHEIKLVPNASNQYTLVVEEPAVANYLMQAVYLAEDGAQYVISNGAAVPGYQDEAPTAKFSNLSVIEREGTKHIVACLDLQMNEGNLFGDTNDDFMVSMKLLDSKGGERVGSVEATETLEFAAVAGKAISVPLPEGVETFTVEAAIAQNGELTHQVKSAVDCNMGMVGCATGTTYEEVAPDVDTIKMIVIAIVTAVIALLFGAFIAHKRRPKVVGEQLPDNDSEI
jgi:hypothetical protein